MTDTLAFAATNIGIDMSFIVTARKAHYFLRYAPGEKIGYRRIAWVRYPRNGTRFPTREEAQAALDFTIALTPNLALAAEIREISPKQMDGSSGDIEQ